jgi:hypothetical protein
MATTPHDNNPNSGYDETVPSNSGNTRKRRTTRRAASKPQPAITNIKIARIETVTMTATEYDAAVEALAVLIARWWDHHPEHHGSPLDQPPDVA